MRGDMYRGLVGIDDRLLGGRNPVVPTPEDLVEVALQMLPIKRHLFGRVGEPTKLADPWRDEAPPRFSREYAARGCLKVNLQRLSWMPAFSRG